MIHHGRKLQCDQSGASEFPAIDGAAKSGLLLAGMASSEEMELSAKEVEALAKIAKMNPTTELPFHLNQLKQRHLIDISSSGSVNVLGLSSRMVLIESANIYETLGPTNDERAAIDLAEYTSNAPQLLANEEMRIAEQFKMRKTDVTEFLQLAQEIGFVDCEESGTDRLLFNGNLFRRSNVFKTNLVLESLNKEERDHVNEVANLLSKAGCLEREIVCTLLGITLFEKLVSAGFYDINTVSNHEGEYAFVTAPAAFHKFVDPMVDDAFDSAKALVAALTYGISKSNSSRGRIMMPSALIGKLLSGSEVGPATAIGQDYRVLELRRVVKLRDAGNSMYFMKLLKHDVGEIAQQVLLHSGPNEQVLSFFPSASMKRYLGPEESRTLLRKQQRPESRKHTTDILQTLREQGAHGW